jgi:hypothetical protein
MPQISKQNKATKTLNHLPLMQQNRVDDSHQLQNQALYTNPMDCSDTSKFEECNSEEQADDKINKTHTSQTLTINEDEFDVKPQRTIPTEDNDNNYSKNNLTNKTIMAIILATNLKLWLINMRNKSKPPPNTYRKLTK